MSFSLTDVSRQARKSARLLGLTLALAAVTILPGCASTQNGEIYEAGILISDPYEDMNRKVFAFNKTIDSVLINPIISGYRTIVPKPARKGIRNVLVNLRSPIDLANQLLQGDLDGAGDILLRTAVNSTVGVAGLFDVAAHEGIEYESEDFGQTLAVWGLDHGPYVVAPFIGPSSFRDYTGFAVDSFADPVRHYLSNVDKDDVAYAKMGASYLDLRDSFHDTLKDLENSSIDYYAAVRSIYYQRRAALIQDGQKGNTPDEEDIFEIPDYDY